MDERALREALRSEAAAHALDPGAVGLAVERDRAHRRVRTALLAALPVVAVAAVGVATLLQGWPGGSGGGAPGAGGSESELPVRLLTQPTVPPLAMQARRDGTLTVTESGCVTITAGESGAGDVLPVAWPHGWTVTRDDTGRAEVYDAEGVRRAREGEDIGLGGGFADYDPVWNQFDPEHLCTFGTRRVFLASGETDPAQVR